MFSTRTDTFRTGSEPRTPSPLLFPPPRRVLRGLHRIVEGCALPVGQVAAQVPEGVAIDGAVSRVQAEADGARHALAVFQAEALALFVRPAFEIGAARRLF